MAGAGWGVYRCEILHSSTKQLSLTMKHLLVLIDPQNDFTSSKGYYATKHGISQISDAKSNISHLFTQLKHEAVIVIADYKPNQFEAGVLLCISGTYGHQIDADIEVPKSLPVFSKCEHSCFSSDEFNKLLKAKQIETLLICGFLAEYCVKQTALDALALGYNATLVIDCIGTGDDIQHRRERTFDELENKGAVLMDSKD